MPPTVMVLPIGSAVPKYFLAVVCGQHDGSGLASTRAGLPATSGNWITWKKLGSTTPIVGRELAVADLGGHVLGDQMGLGHDAGNLRLHGDRGDGNGTALHRNPGSLPGRWKVDSTR